MNKKNVLSFICSFCIVSSTFSMDRETLRRSHDKFSDTENGQLEDDMKDVGATHFIFKFSSSEQSREASSDEADQKSSYFNFTPHEEIQIPQDSESDEIDFICVTCEGSLLNSSFDYIEQLNRYACLECAQIFFERCISLSKRTTSRLSGIGIAKSLPVKLTQKFEDDEPFFDHKKGNAHSHRLSRIYRAKRSLIRAAKQNTIDRASFKQGQLNKLQAQEEL